MTTINEQYNKTYNKLLKSKKQERIISNSTIYFTFKDAVEYHSRVLQKWDFISQEIDKIHSKLEKFEDYKKQEDEDKVDSLTWDIEILRVLEQVINESIFQYVLKQDEMFEVRKEFTQLNRSKSEDYSAQKEIDKLVQLQSA